MKKNILNLIIFSFFLILPFISNAQDIIIFKQKSDTIHCKIRRVLENKIFYTENHTWKSENIQNVANYIVNYKPDLQKQDSVPFRKNSFFVEGLGNAWLYSVNYERLIGYNNNGFMTFRVGASQIDDYIFSILINQVYNRNKNHHLEIGGGFNLPFYVYKKNIHFDTQGFYAAAIGNIMYRYQKPNGHFIFRIGWTPNICLNPDYYTYDYGVGFFVAIGLLWGGASIGYVF